MTSTVIQKIEYGSESETLDFKKSEYDMSNPHAKNEFLKDICAMVNHPSSEDKFIIIGVKEKDGRAEDFCNIEKLTDQAQYQQLLNSNIEPEINFEYKSLNYKGITLAYFRIHGNDNRPYLSKKITKSMSIGSGFIRAGTSTRILDRTDFEKIYERRLQISDRRNDISIVAITGEPKDINIQSKELLFIDIKIENKSNKSIGLDVEVECVDTANFSFFSRFEVEKFIKNSSKKKSSHPPLLNDMNINIPMINHNFNVSVDKTDGKLTAYRCVFRGSKYAIHMSQNSVENKVFMGEIVVLALQEDKEATLSFKVTVRSDDFIDGSLIQNISIPIKFE